MKDAPQNLMDGLFSEMNRVRDIIKDYEDPSLNGAGSFAIVFMRQAIKDGENAIKSGVVLDMITSYEELKSFTN